jgi:two-component system cell cycle sensor histidine kinase/response regulator CckA
MPRAIWCGANRAFAARATGKPDAAARRHAARLDLIAVTEDGQFHFASEPRGAAPLRIVQVPVADQPSRSPCSCCSTIRPAAAGRLGARTAPASTRLLDFLPLGLALANVDGRFVYLNKAFRKAAGLGPDARPSIPAISSSTRTRRPCPTPSAASPAARGIAATWRCA